MKRISCLLIILPLMFSVWAQENPILKVESFQLDNGFTVFLNEDSTATKIFGAVMVNAGAKHESPEATGMAHYLEHLLFKGTEDMGTLDYQKEKPHLDSIRLLYDQLALTSDEANQASLQKQINQQALKASTYGLPNEFDRLLKSIGGTAINAFTNYEMTFYHNSFPSHEIERWLDLYSTRFQNPVFRSFQSELEVVYEEKNRAMDNMQRMIGEEMQEMLFPNLPYGQWSVLGKVEHLKKPSINRMYEFFEKHYVAGNMALILTGNFNIGDVKPMIESRFGRWEEKQVPQLKLPELAAPASRMKKVRMTPIKAGFAGWTTVPNGHPDRIAMDVCEFILYNYSETGLVNQFSLDGKMIYNGSIPFTYNDAAAFSFFYVPKITGSLKKSKKMILGEIDKVIEGDFSDELLGAAKSELAQNFQVSLEDLRSRGISIGEAFNQGMGWEEYLAYPEKIMAVNKADVQRVAKKYLSADPIEMISRTGFGKPKKLQKPPYKPVVTEQKGSSTYAAKYEQMPSKDFEARFLDFEKDIERGSLPGGHEVLATHNPVNQQFDLRIAFKKGTNHDPILEPIAGLMNSAGAGKYALKELKQAFASLGCEYYIDTESNFLTVDLYGPVDKLEEGLKLVNLLLTEPKIDNKALKVYANEIKSERKLEKRTPNLIGRALYFYAILGDQAPNKKRLPVKDIEGADLADWERKYLDVTEGHEAKIFFTGNVEMESLESLLNQNLSLAKRSRKENYIDIKEVEPSENVIYLLNNKKAVQSQIYFHLIGEKFDKEDYGKMLAFNQYFGGGFSGLVLQEIREYRSLAYSAGGAYLSPALAENKGRLYSFIGCQSDKTNDAIEVMSGLLDDLPAKADRIPSLSKNLQLKTITDFPSFSQIIERIDGYQRLGFEKDPNRTTYQEFQDLEMGDILEFYQKYVSGKKRIITIYGDKKRFDLERLSKFGRIVELEVEDIANY